MGKARVCFTTTLLPGVWHGFIIELSVAQPPGTPANFDRNRLNHDYVLASPLGHTRWGPSDPLAPSVADDIYAFQPEFNGTVWFDVLRLMSANTSPETVPVVVFWADATGVAGDITTAVTGLQNAGVVNRGQANALSRKITHAIELIAQGKDAEGILVLQGFIQQLHDLAHIDFVLTPAQADQLIAWAQYLIDSI